MRGISTQQQRELRPLRFQRQETTDGGETRDDEMREGKERRAIETRMQWKADCECSSGSSDYDDVVLVIVDVDDEKEEDE